METITKYKSSDGIKFLKLDECMQHENNCLIAEQIMKSLPEAPSSLAFAKGSGYIQHNKDQLLEVRNAFLEFAKRYVDNKYFQQSIDMGFDAHPSWAGRMLDNCAPRSINKHWYRFMCIDDSFREWGQPYYATHQNEAEQVMLNKI